MRRPLLAIALVVSASVPAAQAQTPAELAQSAVYAAAYQNPDGGFAAKPGGASSLSSTYWGIRTLKNTGGSIRDVGACIAYIKSCYDPKTGGFAQTPGGTPDVRSTALGLMATADL